MPGGSDWITAKEFASIVGCSRESVRKVIREDGKVRRKQLPGMLPQYHRVDAERIVREAENGGAEAARPLMGRGSRAKMDAGKMQSAEAPTSAVRVIPNVGEACTPRPGSPTLSQRVKARVS